LRRWDRCGASSFRDPEVQFIAVEPGHLVSEMDRHELAGPEWLIRREGRAALIGVFAYPGRPRGPAHPW